MIIDKLLSEEMASNVDFLKSVSELLLIDSAALTRLHDNLPSSPSQLSDEEFVESAASKVGLSKKSYQSLAAVARIMVSVVSSGKASSVETTAYFARISSTELSDEKKSEIASFLDKAAIEDESEAEVRAFSYGETFAGVEFQPLIIPQDINGAARRLFGGNITIDYVDSAARRASLSINISLPELREMARQLQREVDRLDRLKSSGGDQA